MRIISTERSQVLAARVAEKLGVPLVEAIFRRFPDGELYLKFGELDDETLIISSIVDNDMFVQTLLAIDAADRSAKTLVIPYLGYSRQDKRFSPGEPISARAVARALSTGVERVYVINIHDRSVLEQFSVPAGEISIAPAIGSYVGDLRLDNPLILAPDEGAVDLASEVAVVGGWDCDHLVKTRLSGEDVRIAPKTVDVAGRDVVIVDDIISTGGTLATAARMLRDQGAVSIHAACVHGVLTSGAYTRLLAAGVSSVVSSDTCESASSLISAANAIATAIREDAHH
ncbi:ribose-phosphate diphosphokinase [Methanoculleus receptaculi]|uniref:Ribose-phosphate pyrophosphokinase n=1 Tax=Methanoculleus receptaculi TaxID=394967 RepID=A0AAX4FWB8_9EURY|nr:ribose-phosphate diphosphokinase [Methanoculleus receptaculi]WOX58080.1 ribose-phosphate diphosphokinase [Methanoculleus receptaculi]